MQGILGKASYTYSVNISDGLMKITPINVCDEK